jgi:hypothetical protein
MHRILRHNKINQRELLLARQEARQAVLEIHQLLNHPDRTVFNVGRTVSMAAETGVLRHRPMMTR